MIFNEIYGVYYNTVSKILKSAIENGTIDDKTMEKIINEYAYAESSIFIISAIKENRWPFFTGNGSSVIKNIPTMPLTDIQKRWLKSISLDPRIKLFDCDFSELEDVEPLFTSDDYFIFDVYADGDNYSAPEYIKNFRIVFSAVKNHTPLEITIKTRKGEFAKYQVIPKYIEYSEKDDKFRLIANGQCYERIINISRIIDCNPCSISWNNDTIISENQKFSYVVIEIKDKRNSLERVMLHFSHFKKETEKIDDDKWRLKIYFSEKDKTELVIRIISFGPMIKVIEPDIFINLIKDRLISQKNYDIL